MTSPYNKALLSESRGRMRTNQISPYMMPRQIICSWFKAMIHLSGFWETCYFDTWLLTQKNRALIVEKTDLCCHSYHYDWFEAL